MQRIVLTRGLLAGAILAVVMAATFPLHEHISYDWALVVGYTSMLVAFLFIYFGIRAYRDTVGGGSIRFGRAVAVGLLIGAVASCCYVATWEVIYFNFAPDYLEKAAEHSIATMRADGASEAAIAERQAEMTAFAEKYRNPFFNAAVTFLEPLPVAVLVTLVSAGVLSRGRASRRANGDALVGATG